MTTSVQLNSVCAARPGFLGVFAADTLPADVQSSTHETSLIVNYGASNTPGSHWCAMRFPRHGAAEWFDSFGQKPDVEDGILGADTDFRAYLLHPAKSYVYNTFDFQSLSDDTCGEWAALFVLAGGLPQNKQYQHVWRPFTSIKSSAKRDRLVRRVIGVRSD